METENLFSLMEKAGAPVGLMAVGAFVLYFADKFKLFERSGGGKTERELLSLDEIEFRRDLLKRVHDLEENCASLAGERADCEDRLATMTNWILRVSNDLRVSGLTDLGPMPPEFVDLANKIGTAAEKPK